MGQGDSARDFGTSESTKNAGILDVFPIFRTARLGQKIRRSPQSPLCGAALVSILFSSRQKAHFLERSAPFVIEHVIIVKALIVYIGIDLVPSAIKLLQMDTAGTVHNRDKKLWKSHSLDGASSIQRFGGML